MTDAYNVKSSMQDVPFGDLYPQLILPLSGSHRQHGLRNLSAFCGWTFGVRVGMNLMMGGALLGFTNKGG